MYLGCKCQYRIDDTTFDEALIAVNLSGYAWTTEPDGEPVEIKDIKLVLRRLSSMSEEEKISILKMRYDYRPETKFEAGESVAIGLYYRYSFGRRWFNGLLQWWKLEAFEFAHLLSLGFDLFGLIDSGLAVEPVPFQGDTNK